MNSKELWIDTLNTKKENRVDLFQYKISKNFNDNINSEVVYKNFNPLDTYNVWISDDNSEKSQFEKKVIRMELNASILQGEYIHWNNDIWLVMGVDTQYSYSKVGSIYKCIEQQLKWVDDTGLHSYPIFSQSKVLRDPLLDNGKVFLVDDSAEVYVQKNADTLKIFENQRFIFGTRTVFKVIEVVDYYITNTIKLLLKKDEQTVGDDFVNQLAENNKYDYLDNVPTEEINGTTTYVITPVDDDKITIGQNITFTVEKYVDEILTPFSCSITQPIINNSFSFTSLNNTFTINNKSQSSLDIIVTINDIDDSYVFDKKYLLRMW